MGEYAYWPASISVARGESVRFVFRNEGSVPHEAVIGDEQAQAEAVHADHGAGAHEESSVQVAPEQAGHHRLPFRSGGRVLIGCHIPGRYESGMQAVVEVIPEG